jgi:hypothetical protein
VLTGLLGHCGLDLTVAGQAGLDLTVVHRLISLPHCLILFGYLRRNEVAMMHRLELNRLHQFICLKGIIFLVLEDICTN